MNEENEKKQKIAELISAIKKAKGIDSEIAPENISISEKDDIPELKIYHTLKEDDVRNLEIISDQEFSDIVDSIILNDYKNIPNAIRLPNLNEQLSEKLGLKKDSAFILKKSATHIRPDRKGGYNQALGTEEYYSIPKVIRETDFVVVDKRTKNFQILFDDNDDIKKINKLVFNKDELGNYLVTVGKVDRRDSISEENNTVVAVGVAPTISALRHPEELPATRLRPSATTVDGSIAQSKENASSFSEKLHILETQNSINEEKIKLQTLEQAKESLNVSTYRFQSGESLEELIRSDNDFPTEAAFLDNLIDVNIREVYGYATEEEQKVLRQFASSRNDYDTDMKTLAVQTDCISRWIAARHWNPEQQEFQKECVNHKAIKDFPYELPWEMKRIESQVLQTQEEIIDNGIESLQENGGMSEAAMEADYEAEQNPRPDYLDENGNPYWFDEEENIEVLDDDEIMRLAFLNDNKETFKAIDDYLEKGKRPKNDEFIFSKNPEILKYAGISENEIVIKTSIINKARNEHSLSDEEIKDSIINIASPILIFDSDKTTTENKKESFLCLTDTFAANGKPIAFSMNLDSDYERKNRLLEVNEIRSIHDRTLVAKNGTDLIQKWTENGLCRYVDDKKISEWSKAAGVQFPLAVLQSDRNNIIPESEIVNDKKISNLGKEREDSFLLPLAKLDIHNVKTYSDFVNQHNIVAENEREYHKPNNEDLTFYYEKFAKEAANENETVQLQKALALALEKNVSPLKEVELNRENWNKMFPDGTVKTPVGTVKLGENQFDKLRRNDRNNLLVAMYETLSNPALILEKETLDEKSGEFRPVNVYGKSFIHEDSNHKRAVESVIIFKDGENISISTHNKNIKDFVKQIKTADQIIYADSEISRVASLILQNGGSHVRLHDATSNRAIREATDSIGTVIARYGYTPGFLEIYDQVGAAASELNIYKENSVVNDKSDEKNQQNESNFDNAVKNRFEAAAQKLSSIDINSENYKEAFELLNRIEKLTGISEPSEKIDFAENEAKENFHPSPNEKIPEEIDNAKIVDEKSEIQAAQTVSESKAESVENGNPTEKASLEENAEIQKEDVSYQEYAAGKVIYGKTVLPPFASMTSDGHLKTCENFIVKSYDSENGTYLVENENEKLSLPRETFNSLLNPAGLYKEQQEEKTFRMEGNGIVFDNPEKGVKGTVIPEFSLMTQNGLQTYKDCVVTKFNESDKTYTLKNGDSVISVTEERFKEITLPERFENKFDENTPSYKKMLKTQYEDFFKERSNTAYNFRHNLSVFCRKEANSPCDALKVAKGIIRKMSPAEQDKTKKLLKKIAREGESLNQLIVRTYHEAIKEVPLNEEYIKQYQPENRIARPFYDTLSSDGQKIDSDPQLLRTDKDYNLKIGDTLKDIDIKSDKIFGHGKENVHFSELKVISASKEGNTVTLMDKEKSFIEIPRDTVLKAYKEQQLKEMNHQQSHSRRNSMEISYR